MGLLSKEIYEADQEFGRWLQKEHPDTYYGYQAWAQVVVDWMSASGPNIMPWILNKEYRMHRQVKWATKWAQEIATPWAEEMSYRMGQSTKGNRTGALLMSVGMPISNAIGKIQRWFGKSDKPAGVFTAITLVSIFSLLRVIVYLGKLLESKYKEQLA
jgi:hypothetical protein